MIKVTLIQLVEAMAGEDRAPLRKLTALDLPVKYSWPFGDTLLEAIIKNKQYYEARQKLFVKYGTPTLEGNLTVGPENRETFAKDNDELLATEIELPGDKIPKDAILANEKNQLSANDCALLRPFTC
jgi:hypothetical protein